MAELYGSDKPRVEAMEKEQAELKAGVPCRKNVGIGLSEMEVEGTMHELEGDEITRSLRGQTEHEPVSLPFISKYYSFPPLQQSSFPPSTKTLASFFRPGISIAGFLAKKSLGLKCT